MSEAGFCNTWSVAPNVTLCSTNLLAAYTWRIMQTRPVSHYTTCDSVAVPVPPVRRHRRLVVAAATVHSYSAPLRSDAVVSR